jgi:hypothetical protein
MTQDNNNPPADGGAAPPTDGGVKMVPESDLMAVKANLTQTVSDLTTARGEIVTQEAENRRLTDLAATHQGDATTAKARIAELSPLEAQIAESEKTLGAEKARADAAVSALDGSQKDLLDLRKTNLKEQYGLEDGVLEGKTLSELVNYTEALALLPTNGKGRARFDGGGGGGGSEAISARASIAAGLADNERLGPLGRPS